MALKIIEHKPVYSSGTDSEPVEFSSMEGLLAIDFVQSHSRQLGFYRYSLNKSSDNVRVPFLAEYNNGEKWLVIGFLEGDISALQLPDWKPSDPILSPKKKSF